jgi:hypothetical protein
MSGGVCEHIQRLTVVVSAVVQQGGPAPEISRSYGGLTALAVADCIYQRDPAI